MLAAEDLAAANCTRHRGRARLRVLRAVEAAEAGLASGGSDVRERPEREALLVDLAEFVREAAEEDPRAHSLLQRCFNHGVIGR
jgi:hypothetical protein